MPAHPLCLKDRDLSVSMGLFSAERRHPPCRPPRKFIDVGPAFPPVPAPENRLVSGDRVIHAHLAGTHARGDAAGRPAHGGGSAAHGLLVDYPSHTHWPHLLA